MSLFIGHRPGGRRPARGARPFPEATIMETPTTGHLTPADPAVDAWFRHVDHLARVIGARGSTTPAEARAADYARQTLERAGLAPQVESFNSVTSAWWPFSLATALTLVAVALYPLAGRVTAVISLVIIAAAATSALREVNMGWSPLRLLLPRRPSRNVWAPVPAAGDRRHRVAVIGHLDTHRTPLLFSSLGWQQVMHIVVPAGFVAMVALVALFVAGAFLQMRALYLASLAPAALVALVLLLTVQADLTPYTPGANDNATGAGLVLALAESLAAQPLANTEVWLVATGCEEVGCYGAIDFYRRHRDDLRDAVVLVVDTVGGPGSGPCYLRSEGMLLPHRYDAGLLALADAIAAGRPELGAYSRKMTEAYTEGLPALQAGLRPLTLCGFTPGGVLPNWHQPSDTVENIDLGALARNYAFVRELLQRIDSGPA